MSRDGYAFVLERPDVDKLKAMSDFEGREEPAVAEDFLRFRAESWADILASAGAEPGEIAVARTPLSSSSRLSDDVQAMSAAFVAP